MLTSANSIPEDFFTSHNKSGTGDTVYIPLHFGFLKLEYGGQGKNHPVRFISFVLENQADAMAVGRRLEFIWDDGGSCERVTFITENGISGEQWYKGSSFSGNTLDIDNGNTGYTAVSLEDWISDCLDDMIHPTDNDIEERKRIDAADAAFMRRNNE